MVHRQREKRRKASLSDLWVERMRTSWEETKEPCSVILVRALLRKTQQPRGYWVVGHRSESWGWKQGRDPERMLRWELPQLPQQMQEMEQSLSTSQKRRGGGEMLTGPLAWAGWKSTQLKLDRAICTFNLGQNVGSGVRLWHLSGGWTWARYLVSLGLSFLLGKVSCTHQELSRP